MELLKLVIPLCFILLGLLYVFNGKCLAAALQHDKDISPCSVRNMIVQPRLGISVKTKKTVDILQIPPLLNQNILVSICIENYERSSDSAHHDSNSSNYICRQRYSAVEVFSKLMHETFQPKVTETEGDKIKLEYRDERVVRGFTKDFVIIEAGCDIIVDPSTSSTTNSFTRRNFSKQFENAEELRDLASTYREGRRRNNNYSDTSNTKNTQAPLSSTTHRRRELPDRFNSKRNFSSHDESDTLAPRPGSPSNFFRLGLHVNSSDLKHADNSSTGESTVGKVETFQPPPFASSESTDEGKSHHEKNTNNNGNYTNSREMVPPPPPNFENKVELAEGEFLLKIEDIGLPILILEPSLDPIMRLIESI